MSAHGSFMAFKIVGAILWIPIIIVLAAFLYELWNEFND
jgi:membrane protein DedA with SNARE-associated domain